MLELLKLEAQEIVVPKSVAEEILRRGSNDITVRVMENETWLKVVEDLPAPDAVRAWDLGEGETGVLAWGYANPGTTVIIDDLAARRCAA